MWSRPEPVYVRFMGMIIKIGQVSFQPVVILV